MGKIGEPSRWIEEPEKEPREWPDDPGPPVEPERTPEPEREPEKVPA